MNQTNPERRLFLQGILTGGAVLLGSALLRSPQAWAAWNEAAFTADSLDSALQGLYEGAEITESDRITLKAPDIAENGAVVPISVETDLENVESISIIVADNPSPLAAQFELPPDAVADVSTRIKMGKTSNVIAVVKADGKLYSVQKEVKVTIGGCGG